MKIDLSDDKWVRQIRKVRDHLASLGPAWKELLEHCTPERAPCARSERGLEINGLGCSAQMAGSKLLQTVDSVDPESRAGIVDKLPEGKPYSSGP